MEHTKGTVRQLNEDPEDPAKVVMSVRMDDQEDDPDDSEHEDDSLFIFSTDEARQFHVGDRVEIVVKVIEGEE